MFNFNASPFGNLSQVNAALPNLGVANANNQMIQALLAKNVTQNENMGGQTVYQGTQDLYNRAGGSFDQQFNTALNLYNNTVAGMPDQYARALNLSQQYSKDYINTLANTFNPLIQDQTNRLTQNAYGLGGNLSNQYGNIRANLNSTGNSLGQALGQYGSGAVNWANAQGNSIAQQLRNQGLTSNMMLGNDINSYIGQTQNIGASNLMSGINTIQGGANAAYGQLGYNNALNAYGLNQAGDAGIYRNTNLLNSLGSNNNQFANQAVNEFNQKGDRNLRQFNRTSNQDQNKAFGATIGALTNPNNYATQLAAYNQALGSAKAYQDSASNSIRGGTDDFLKKMAKSYQETIGRSPYAV